MTTDVCPARVAISLGLAPDELASPELRAKMVTLTERLESHGASLEDELLADVLNQRWHDEIHAKDGITDDVFCAVMEWTGYDAFYDAWVATGVHPDSVPLDPAI